MATEASFFEQVDQVKKAITEPADHRQAISELEPLLNDPDIRREFYTLLQSADWITPLEQAGYFDAPPGAEPTLDGGVRYPPWTASRYLVRMAAQAPGEVAAIFAKIKTNNASVIGDMVDAALAMPADVAATLVPAVCQAVKDGTLWLSFKDASDLCVRLTKGGELDSAMKLVEALFSPTFENGREKLSQRDEYWYKEGLKKVVPILARAKAKEFLPKMCDWLKASIKAKKHVDPESGTDLSYIWRPAIEEHEQNSDYHFAGLMVGFVREGFEEAIRNGGLSLEDAFQIIGRYTYLVFKRIRLHLIGEFADQDQDLARKTILTRELFDDHQYKHEYAMLVGRRFGLLSQQQRNEWFGWIDAAPVKDDVDPEASEEVQQAQAKWRRFQRLHWVRTHLEGERKSFYEQILAQHGEPKMADLNISTGPVSYGYESPMTVDELTGMTFEQAVNVVSSWRPEESRFMGPSIEGLGSTFKQYVAANPEEFSSKAQVLIDRPAIFVRGFMSQMSEAAKAGREINLPAVFELCRWVVGRPVEERTTPEQEDELLVDKNWQWSRDEIARLVENVCQAKSGETPRYPLDGIRNQIWGLIECLCRDRVKRSDSHDISEDDPRVYDYLNLGIVSPRGQAVEAALEYARWVTNHIKTFEGKQEVVPGGFDAMPEVCEELMWQIAPENRSFETMSVIGSRINVIYVVDKAWLAKNAEQIFQLAGTPPTAQGWAAWNAFLVWVRPHIEYYRIFKSQFAYAVEQAAKVGLTEHSREQPMHHLGEHLMVFYARGELGLDEDNGLLRRFLKTAVPSVRRHAIDFVGRILKGDKKVPEEVIKRFMALWDLYWADQGRKDAEEEPDVWMFGTWFSCGQFPEQWALDQLEQFVEVVPISEPDHAVAERLADVASIDPAKSVHILDRMVRGDREGWHIHSWRDSAKTVLQTAMKTDGNAREMAVKLINYLGRRGHMEFGKLLEP